MGGQEVTIIGDDFNGGTLYLCAFGDVRDEDDFTAVQGQFTKGQKLACHCAPRPCHGSNYLTIVFATEEELELLIWAAKVEMAEANAR